MRGVHELQFDLRAAYVPAAGRREAAQAATTATRRCAAWPSQSSGRWPTASRYMGEGGCREPRYRCLSR